MIWEQPEPGEPLSQGDIFDDGPILFWQVSSAAPESATLRVRAVVLTQSCDLAQGKSSRVLVAVVHKVQHLVDRGVLQPKVIRDQIRTHRIYGWYFLPSGEGSLIDLGN